jgi:hypothetical protein
VQEQEEVARHQEVVRMQEGARQQKEARHQEGARHQKVVRHHEVARHQEVTNGQEVARQQGVSRKLTAYVKRGSKEWKDKRKRARGRTYKRRKRAGGPIDIQLHKIEQEMLVRLKASPTSHLPPQFLNQWNQEPFHDFPPQTPNGDDWPSPYNLVEDN